MTRVHIHPSFDHEDKGDGGVRRVVEACIRWLPTYGVDVVSRMTDADVLVAHMYASEKQLKRQVSTPLVVHSHGLYWGEYDWSDGSTDKTTWYYKANSNCMESIRQADVVTGPSEWVSKAIARHTLRPVVPLWHGIETDEWLDTGDEGFVLWNKNRVDPVCEPEDMDELARMCPDVPFVSTFSNKNPPNVQLTGQLPYETAKRLVKDCAVYLLTPRETFGIGALEAMASGKPVLAWKWGGQAEFIKHEVTGYLATHGDYEDLHNGLRYCMENRKRMGEAARQDAEERFQWRDRVAPYADIYKALHEAQEVERPRVSVVVPAYNLAELLPRALDSVANQSVDDWECVVVDDHSPDDTNKVARAYARKDKRFRVVRNKENQYLAGALNTGIAASRGRYVIPLDADNELPPQTIELLANALDTKRDIHIAYGNVEFVEPDGQRWHSGWPMAFRGEWQARKQQRGDRPSNYVPSTAMYRRSMWDYTGGYRRRFRTAEDADFWTRATSFGFRAEMVTDADTLVYYNREGSMSRVNEMMDWTEWYPWARDDAPPPGGIIRDEQVPIFSYDPAKATVVIPVGPGHAELYVDAVDSVIAQTMQDFDLVIVNDTGFPLRWKPSFATVIDTNGGIGVAAARNMGIAASTSRLFVPLDADDMLEPDALQWFIDAWLKNGGYVYGDWYDMFDSPDMETKHTEAQDYMPAELLNNGCLHSVTGLYERADWERVGGFDESLPAWEDWDFQLKLAEVAVCGTRIAAPTFVYRKDKGVRREENYANFDSSKDAIHTKWADYFDGRKELMGCSACGGGGGSVNPMQSSTETWQQSQAISMPEASSDLAVVEYIGRQKGGVVYRGPTGQQYRFADDEGERIRYVLPDDVEFFESRNEFRIRDTAGATT